MCAGEETTKARRLLLREKSHLKGEEETILRAHKAPAVVFVFTSCRRKTAIHEVLRFFRIALPQWWDEIRPKLRLFFPDPNKVLK